MRSAECGVRNSTTDGHGQTRILNLELRKSEGDAVGPAVRPYQRKGGALRLGCAGPSGRARQDDRMGKGYLNAKCGIQPRMDTDEHGFLIWNSGIQKGMRSAQRSDPTNGRAVPSVWGVCRERREGNGQRLVTSFP